MSVRETACHGEVSVGKPMTRALRRSHRRRMIRYGRSIFAGDQFPEQLRVWAGKRHDHLCRCLCYLCHNRRKKFGRTLQERRLLQCDPIPEFASEHEEKTRGR